MQMLDVTQIPIPEGADPDAAEYFARLRALQIGVEEAWYRYIAGELNPAQYLVELTTGKHGRRRLLERDEAFWWVLGMGDGYGHGDLVLAEPNVPELMTLEAGAEALGLSVEGVRYRLDTGRLYLAFPGGRRRLIAVQVAAVGGAPRYEAEWTRMRAMWPPDDRIRDLPAAVRPAADDSAALPVPANMANAKRRILALTLASEAELILYRYVDQDRDVYGVTVVRDGHTVRRELPGPAVLPWVQGIADSAGRYGLVAYRPGLA